MLDELSLSFASGDVVGIGGINGSGKTMLLRAIGGLIRPTKGTVSIDGKTLFRDISFPPSTGALIEEPVFLDSYTGLKNLKLLAAIKGRVGQEELVCSMQRVGLGEAGKKPFRKYSLGMKQRLGIAVAVMEAPDLILLNEPTNALDAKGVELLKGIVVAESRRGAAVVMASYDREVLFGLSDVVYLMEEGRIVEIIARNQPKAGSHA